MILIALGSNLPFEGSAPRAVVEAALAALERESVHVVARSRWWSCAPVPPSEQARFVNGVVQVETMLAPRDLLSTLHRVEDAFGRVRTAPNAARTLDLDLLDYHGQVVNEALILPHPRLAERGFVLFPLAEVAPEWRHPLTGRSVAELIAALPPQDCRLI